MDKENIAGAIIMALCCSLCAATFLGIGIFAEKAKKPVSFWSGTTVPPEKVQDLKGYNHANAVMWKLYSLLFWAAALLGLLGIWKMAYTVAAAILLSLACVPGMFFLIWRYRSIEKKYLRP